VTGDTSEQVMFILFGSGANGKSTFLNTIMHILGDYATVTQTETFTAPERALFSIPVLHEKSHTALWTIPQ
jgi:phage/plasmid-associated DNA primase